MKKCSQGVTKYLLVLGAVLVLVAGAVDSILLTSQTLDSNIPGQVGMISRGLDIKFLFIKQK